MRNLKVVAMMIATFTFLATLIGACLFAMEVLVLGFDVMGLLYLIMVVLIAALVAYLIILILLCADLVLTGRDMGR